MSVLKMNDAWNKDLATFSGSLVGIEDAETSVADSTFSDIENSSTCGVSLSPSHIGAATVS